MSNTAYATSCARCQTPLASDDLRCSICALAAPLLGHGAALTTTEQAQVLRCAGCGAAVKYVAAAQAPQCAFCSAVMKLEQPSDPVEEAEAFLPFRVPPEAASAALADWLGTLGWFRPAKLAREAKLEALRPLWWAAWLVDAHATVSWTADSDHGSGQSAWAPHAGRSDLTFENLLISASRGLRHDETEKLAPWFDLRTLVPHAHTGAADNAGDAGITLEGFELQRSSARHHVVRAIEATAAARLQGTDIPGTSFRKVQVAVLLERLQTRRVALPTYVLAYRYGKRHYRAVVHGQDPSCVFGEAPYAWGKISLVVLAVAAVIAGIIAIVASR
jgi:hypothetical protein